MPAPPRPTADELGLPPRPFLYTLDQIADLLVVGVKPLRDRYVHFDGRSTGVPNGDKLLARNIAPEGVRPEWRVEERELIRWFTHRGFRPVARINWAR